MAMQTSLFYYGRRRLNFWPVRFFVRDAVMRNTNSKESILCFYFTLCIFQWLFKIEHMTSENVLHQTYILTQSGNAYNKLKTFCIEHISESVRFLLIKF